MGENRKKINGKELVLDISYDIVGSVLYALGIYTFAKTADFAPGGLSGLALIMNHLWRSLRTKEAPHTVLKQPVHTTGKN